VTQQSKNKLYKRKETFIIDLFLWILTLKAINNLSLLSMNDEIILKGRLAYTGRTILLLKI